MQNLPVSFNYLSVTCREMINQWNLYIDFRHNLLQNMGSTERMCVCVCRDLIEILCVQLSSTRFVSRFEINLLQNIIIVWHSTQIRYFLQNNTNSKLIKKNVIIQVEWQQIYNPMEKKKLHSYVRIDWMAKCAKKFPRTAHFYLNKITTIL